MKMWQWLALGGVGWYLYNQQQQQAALTAAQTAASSANPVLTAVTGALKALGQTLTNPAPISSPTNTILPVPAGSNYTTST